MTMEQFKGLSLRILLLAAAALLPVLLLMAWMGWVGAGEKVDRERMRAAHLAELLAREQALPFTLGRQLLHSLAMMRALEEPLDAAVCAANLKRAAAENDYVTAIKLYSPQGETLCSSADGPSPPVGDRAWFRLAVGERRMVVSDYLVGRATGKNAIVMGLPLTNGEDRVRAVLGLGLDLAWIGRALSSVPVAPGTNIVLVDGNGAVLAPERWLGMSVAEHPVFKRVQGITTQTSFEAVGIDGVERIFVARPLNPDLGGRSYIWVATPKSSASHAALKEFLSGTLLVFATVIALLAVIWWQGSRVVLRPVRHLREAARQLSRSHLSARTNLPHSDDEIGQLAATFDEMAETIETRERELEHSRESLLQANRTLRVITAVKDVIVRAESKDALFRELCRAMAAVGGYPTLFVARAEHDPGRTVTVLAVEGLPAEYGGRLKLSWGDDEFGRGSVGTAIRENRVAVIQDALHDPRWAPWREVGRKLGYTAVAALPLRVDGAVWGVLGLSSRQAGGFDDEEMRLLEELAGDVGRGIETLRLRAEKQTAEAALREVMGDLERRVGERTAELEQVNRELEAFSYSISHDLRAPLRAIDGFAEALDEECGELLNPACKDYLARIRGAAQRMGDLIDDMIDLARISHTEITTAAVDLSALAAEVGAELAEAEPSRSVHLTVAPGLVAQGDPVLLRGLLQNLFENAWKYTAHVSPPQVEFGQTRLPWGEPAFFVRDNGAGFDMAFADRLFRPFSRLHRAEEYPGTGIGLATVARIASRHGGRVWAEGAKGRGATFYFVLGQAAG